MSSQTMSFPRHYWEAEKGIANLVLAEFFGADDWKSITLPPPPDHATTQQEIAELFKLVQLRAARKSDVLLQADNVFPYYFARLMMAERSHPRTYEAMLIAIIVGRALVMHFKRQFGRVRPVQLAPDLEPMIPTPGHPAYPAGHPFQAKLMSLLLAELRPDAKASLIALAENIGENREVAGVHYRSDTLAGLRLADLAFVELMKCPTVVEVMAAARSEWA